MAEAVADRRRAGAAGRPARHRGAGHQHRRRGHPRPLDPRRRCWPPVPRSRSAGRRPPTSCSPSPPAGAAFRPVGISAGLAPVADARAVAELRRAHRRRRPRARPRAAGGLVAAAARRLAPRRPGRWCSPCTTPFPRAAACAGGCWPRSSATTIRGADVVLAASGDLADNARRLGGARRPHGAGLRAAAAAGRAARARRCAPSSASTTGGRWSSRSAGCTRRRATTSSWTRPPAGSPATAPVPLVAIAGDGPLHGRARRPDRAPSGCR